MVHIILASHGDLANGMLNSIEILSGPQKDIETIELKPGNSIDSFSQNLARLIKNNIEKGKKVLVLTDLFGGSPANSAVVALQNLKFTCLAGMNSPMVLEAILRRNTKNLHFPDYVEKVEAAGTTGVVNINKKIAEMKSKD